MDDLINRINNLVSKLRLQRRIDYFVIIFIWFFSLWCPGDTKLILLKTIILIASVGMCYQYQIKLFKTNLALEWDILSWLSPLTHFDLQKINIIFNKISSSSITK